MVLAEDGIQALSPKTHGREALTLGLRVAVKELKLSYYIGETPLFTIYTHYGNLNPKP